MTRARKPRTRRVLPQRDTGDPRGDDRRLASQSLRAGESEGGERMADLRWGRSKPSATSRRSEPIWVFPTATLLMYLVALAEGDGA